MKQHHGGADFLDVADLILRDLKDRVGLDSWWIARRRGNDHVLLAALDDPVINDSAFDDIAGPRAGTVMMWEDTFCAQMLSGNAPNAAGRIEDAPAYLEARQRNGLPAAAVLSLPLTSPSGDVVGTLCATGRKSHDHLDQSLATVHVQAQVLGTLLSHELRLIDEVRRAEHAERAAQTDALTEVGNRRAWDAALAAEEIRATRYASAVSILIIDLDGLKTINDTEGHHAGDQVLRSAARLLNLNPPLVVADPGVT